MANEIRIIVKAYDQVSDSFKKIDNESKKTASDIEGEFLRSGKKVSESLGRDITEGVKKGGAGAKKEIENLGKGDGGNSLGGRLKEGIGKGINLGFLEGMPAVASFGIGAAPLLGGLLSAGIIGGAGLGGVIGGVALAAKDPRVADAGKTLGKNLMDSLSSDAKVFVGPVLDSIDTIGQGFETRLRPKIQSIFSNSSTFVKPLTEGLMKGLDGLLTGFDKAVSKAGPVIGSISHLIAETGDAVGDMLTTVSGGSDDAAKALDDLTDLLGGTIRGLGYVIRGLTEFYGVLHDTGEGIGNFINTISGVDRVVSGEFTPHLADASQGADDFGRNLTNMQMRAEGAEGPITTLTTQINEFSAAGRSAFSATTNVAEALDQAREAAQKNGETLDENTKKGRANRQALSAVAEAAISQYNATVKLNGEGEKANSVANTNRSRFIALAQSMGQSRGAAEKLADELGLIKAPKPINIVTNSDATRRKVAALQAEINRMHGRVLPITVRVTRQGETLYGNQAPQMASGGIKGAASGQGVSGLTWVGEHGPELVDLPAGSTVKSNPDSMRMAQSGGGSGGRLEIVLRFDPSHAPAAIAGVMEGLRGEIRGQGGNVQLVLGDN